MNVEWELISVCGVAAHNTIVVYPQRLKTTIVGAV